MLSSALLLVAVSATRHKARAADPPIDRAFSVENFLPPIGPQGYLSVEGAGVLLHKNFSVGTLFRMSRGGYSVFTVNSGNGLEGAATEVVKDQIGADLSASYGLKGKYQFGFSLPFAIKVKGDGLSDTGGPEPDGLSTTGLGDLRLGFKWQAFGGADASGLAVAVAPEITVPTSGGKDFLGESVPTFRPRVLIESVRGPISAALNFGLIFRKPRTLLSSDVSQELTFGVAGAFRAVKSLSIYAELFGRNGFSSDLDSSPVEFASGLRLHLGSVSVLLGGGTGVVKGLGAPEWRTFLGVQYAPNHKDSDLDGVYDVNESTDYRGESCLLIPEDRDGFEDSDGCPDFDNDNDGIADKVDRCRDDKEDKDGTEDEDGCPDKDDDGDGIPDIQDSCPKLKEDRRAPNTHDGCPITASDADGDGVSDANDRCPKEAEDMDGHDDQDGCLDADDDGDGVVDRMDECRDATEDRDGFQDEDGCPEPDNDQDGVLDAQDKCAGQVETINGHADDDGCEDGGGKSAVKPGKNGVLTLIDSLTWERDLTTLAPKSADAMDQLALWMRRTGLNVEAWRVVVSPEPIRKKSAELMQAIAQNRANSIAAALIARGIPKSAVEAVGVKADEPVTMVVVAKRKGPAKPESEEPVEEEPEFEIE